MEIIALESTVLILTLTLFVIVVIVYISACSSCGEAAKDRGRSGGNWWWMAFFGTPFLAAVLLIALGDTKDKREERITEEETLRERIRQRIKIKEEAQELLSHKPATHQQSTPESDFRQRGEEHARYQPTTPEKGFNPSAKTVGDMYKRRY